MRGGEGGSKNIKKISLKTLFSPSLSLSRSLDTLTLLLTRALKGLEHALLVLPSSSIEENSRIAYRHSSVDDTSRICGSQ